MATRLGPFHAGFSRPKRLTLAEIEAAANGINNSKYQPSRRGSQMVSEWVRNQARPRNSGNLMSLDHLATFFNPNQRIGLPLGSRFPRSVSIANTNRPTHSSLIAPSGGLKRKASRLDREGFVILQEPPHKQRRGLGSRTVIDLTGEEPRRNRSFLGHRDEDVIIIDPPVAEIRSDIRRLALGPLENEIHAEEASGRQRPGPGPLMAGGPRASSGRNRPRPAPTQSQTPSLDRAGPENRGSQARLANLVQERDQPQAAKSVFQFFALAGEIRDNIYRHLLVSAKPIHVKALWTEVTRRISPRGRHMGIDETIKPSILLACRQAAAEGTRVLYSENTFLYLLRDPETAESNNSSGGSGGGRNKRTGRGRGTPLLNLAKYGHLIRHMAIELEPNRTGAPYQELMARALEVLVPSPASSGIPSSPCIHLHMLTISVSPLPVPGQRTVRSAGSDSNGSGMANSDGRYLSVVNLFNRGARVLKALQRIDTNFLRINVHVNSNTRNSIHDESPFDETSDSDSDVDSLSDGETASQALRVRKPRQRHLETTIDLRYLPRHMEALRREPVLGNLWEGDVLMQEERKKRGVGAARALNDMRRHIEEACEWPEKAVAGGFWEDHSVAERNRRKAKARDEARFDEDTGAFDRVGNVRGEDADGRVHWPMKSLIISIDRVGGDLRAYRA